MIWALLIAGTVAAALVSVLITCGIAWLILSRWLDGRSLVIACVACAIAAGLGQSFYSGPANFEALQAFLRAAATIIWGLAIARIWLARVGAEADG